MKKPKSVTLAKRRMQAEADRIAVALRKPNVAPDVYCQLYAAQQALCWAIDPEMAGAPLKVIMTGKVYAPTVGASK